MLHKRRGTVSSHEEKRMHRSYRLAGGIISLVLLLGVGQSLGRPLNTTTIDVLGNTAVGTNALVNTTTDAQNTTFGFQEMTTMTTGIHNTAVGHNALVNATTSNNNVAVG